METAPEINQCCSWPIPPSINPSAKKAKNVTIRSRCLASSGHKPSWRQAQGPQPAKRPDPHLQAPNCHRHRHRHENEEEDSRDGHWCRDCKSDDCGPYRNHSRFHTSNPGLEKMNGSIQTKLWFQGRHGLSRVKTKVPGTAFQ
jgi:hypothetical protein